MQGAAHGQNYDDLVAQGYRWVNVDGPYACPTKEDLREITSNPSAINKVHMVEQIRAYFLIQGALVKVIQEDRSTGMAQIRMAGITIDLWTFSKFLSKRPIADTYSVIETPEAAGLVPSSPRAIRSVLEGKAKASDVSPQFIVTTHGHRQGGEDIDSAAGRESGGVKELSSVVCD